MREFQVGDQVSWASWVTSDGDHAAAGTGVIVSFTHAPDEQRAAWVKLDGATAGVDNVLVELRVLTLVV